MGTADAQQVRQVQRAQAALDRAVLEEAGLRLEIEALERQRAAAAAGDAAAVTALAGTLTATRIAHAAARRRVLRCEEALRRRQAAALRQLQAQLGETRAQAEHTLDLVRQDYRRGRTDAAEVALRWAGVAALGLRALEELAAAAPIDPPPGEERP